MTRHPRYTAIIRGEDRDKASPLLQKSMWSHMHAPTWISPADHLARRIRYPAVVCTRQNRRILTAWRHTGEVRRGVLTNRHFVIRFFRAHWAMFRAWTRSLCARTEWFTSLIESKDTWTRDGIRQALLPMRVVVCIANGKTIITAPHLNKWNSSWALDAHHNTELSVHVCSFGEIESIEMQLSL